MGKLTVLGIKALKPSAKRTKHPDGDNLNLVIEPSGSRRWLFIYRVKGRDGLKDRQREMGLGGVDKVSLAQARARSAELREMIGRGIDPLDTRAVAAAAPQVPTFATFAEAHIKTQEPAWKGPTTAAGWRNTLLHHAAAIGPLRLDEIGIDDVLGVLKPIWHTKPETAQQTQRRIEVVLDAAKVMGHRTGENPARWRGHLKHVMTAKVKLSRGPHRSLPYAEVAAFMNDLAWRDGAGARGLEFGILTVAREAMVTGARWSEIDMVEATWTVPAVRMKGPLKDAKGRPFVIPLSTQAMDLLRAAHVSRPASRKSTDLIFPGSRAGTEMSNATMDSCLTRMGVDAVPHGFRATFKTWAEEKTDHPREIIEMAMAHKVGDATEQAYRRGTASEKRARLMADWGKFVMSKVVARGHEPASLAA